MSLKIKFKNLLFSIVLCMPSLALAVSPVNTGQNTSPITIAVGDVNRDGNPDLVVGDRGSGNIHVLIGNGAGVFTASASVPVFGALTGAILLADFNGDGNLDILSAGGNGASVVINFGDGAGAFGVPTVLRTGATSTCSVASDLNNDGNLDVVVTHWMSGTVDIFMGNGAGSFVRSSINSPGSESVAIGDFNGDGIPDLAIANFYSNASNIGMYLGNGAGGFGAVTTFPSKNPRNIKTADLNNDGNLDLAVTNNSGVINEDVSVLLGNGTGGFGAPTYFASNAAPDSLAIGDINGDGILDLAVASLNSDNVGILLGNGTGAFGAVLNTPAFSPIDIVSSDLNNDGKADLAIANHNSDIISFLLTSPETILPVGVLLINNDAPSTSSLNVTLSLSCNDISGCVRMSFSNDGVVWSPWQLFSANANWVLLAGFDGVRTVHTKYQDGWGNENTSNDSISLVTYVPPSPPVTVAPQSGGGCVINTAASFDPVMLVLLLLSMIHLKSRAEGDATL